MSPTPRTLIEIIGDLEPVLHDTLSTIRLEWRPEGATAQLSFCLSRWAGKQSVLHDHAIAVDQTDLPAGIAVTSFERWPDRFSRLALTPDAKTQIRDLDRLGTLGRLDASEYRVTEGDRSNHAAISWIIKTHAGSDAERAAWIRGISGYR